MWKTTSPLWMFSPFSTAPVDASFPRFQGLGGLFHSIHRAYYYD